jgi:hypothetical protein
MILCSKFMVVGSNPSSDKSKACELFENKFSGFIQSSILIF